MDTTEKDLNSATADIERRQMNRAYRIALIYGEGAVDDEIIADLILDLAALADKDYGGIEHRLRVVEVSR